MDCTFPDLPNTSNFYNATCYLYSKEVLHGTASGDMLAEDPITRLHTAKIAFRGVYSVNNRTIPSSVHPDNYPSIYSDLNISTAGHDLQAAKALLYLEYDDGISPFDRNNTIFNPDATITRVDALKVLLETFNIKPDVSSTDSYSSEDVKHLKNNNPFKFGYIYQAKNLGIIDDIDAFRPFEECKRGEAFLMLYRIMTKVNAGTLTDPDPSVADYFEPVNTTVQNLAKGAQVELGNFNHYTRTSFMINGTAPLELTHSYNSYSAEYPDDFYGRYDKGLGKIITYKPLGPGWSHNYHTFLTVLDLGGGVLRMAVHWGGGVVHIYGSDGANFVCESAGVYDEAVISPSTGVVTIKTKSQVEYRFKKHGAGKIMELYSVKDRNGNEISIAYETGQDAMSRIASVSDGNRSLTFAYKSGTNLLSQVSDPLGRTVAFEYTPSSYADEGYMLSGFTDANGNRNNYYYAGDDNAKRSKLLSRIQLPKGNYIENEYDENRRLKQSTSVKDGVIKSKTNVSVVSSYESSSNPLNSTVQTLHDNANSYTYNYKFNENNNATQITGSHGLNVTANYGDAQNPLLPTSMSGNSRDLQSIQYDDKGNVTQITRKSLDNTETRVVKMAYNSDNTLKSVTDPNNNTTYYDYDSQGNLISVREPENSTTNYEVNSRGLTTKITNPENISTEFDYNIYGNLQTTTIPALGVSSSTEYDAASRVTGVKDFLDRETKFTYDAVDNLLTEVNALNHTTSYAYDVNGNLTSVTNAKGGVTSFSYDNVTDLLTSESFGGSTKQYAYNDDGTLKTFTKPDGTNIHNSYDDLGRIVSDGANSYTYDDRHRLSTVVKDGKTLSFEYDGFNQVTGVTYSDFPNNKVSYSYDLNGSISSITYPGDKTVTYAYDAMNRMTGVTDWNSKTITYSYFKDNRLQSVAYPNGMTLTYAYDNAGRQTGKTLKRADNSVIASYSFTLDKAGNIIAETRTEPYAGVLRPNENVSYTYNSANRITKADNTAFTFDANGNTKTRGSDNYDYDQSDKLISGDGFSFEYDGSGNIRSNGNKRYMIDVTGTGNVIAETDMSGNPSAYYVYGLELESRILSDGTTEYYVSDSRGSVVAMTDASNSANITHKYQYDEFGNITQSQENDVNPFRYTGKHGVMYASNNLYYMRARFYDPTIGRFLTEDPIWSTNLYPYADNNPVMGIDPEGLATELGGATFIATNTQTSAGNFLNTNLNVTKESSIILKTNSNVDNWISVNVATSKAEFIQDKYSLYAGASTSFATVKLNDSNLKLEVGHLEAKAGFKDMKLQAKAGYDVAEVSNSFTIGSCIKVNAGIGLGAGIGGEIGLNKLEVELGAGVKGKLGVEIVTSGCDLFQSNGEVYKYWKENSSKNGAGFIIN
jgi:RHS repeat-associated protein